jgi:hypothetical protein
MARQQAMNSTHFSISQPNQPSTPSPVSSLFFSLKTRSPTSLERSLVSRTFWMSYLVLPTSEKSVLFSIPTKIPMTRIYKKSSMRRLIYGDRFSKIRKSRMSLLSPTTTSLLVRSVPKGMIMQHCHKCISLICSP